MSQWGAPPAQLAAAPPPRPSGLRRKSVLATVFAVVIVLLVGAALYSAGVFTPATDASSGNQSPDTSTPPTAAPSTAPPEEIPGKTIGTPENPYSPGDSFSIEDWTFTVGETDTDSWPELLPRFERDLPKHIARFQPEPGMVFVSAPVSMTYTGPPETQQRANGHGVHHIAADGTSTRDGNCGQSGGAVDRYEFGAYYSEPSTEGTSCVELFPEQVSGGQWRIAMFFTDDRYIEVFYTAE